LSSLVAFILMVPTTSNLLPFKFILILGKIYEMWLHFYPSFQFLTNFEVPRLLIIAQQSQHKLCSDAPHGKIFT
jgi:hypothetical protein